MGSCGKFTSDIPVTKVDGVGKPASAPPLAEPEGKASGNESGKSAANPDGGGCINQICSPRRNVDCTTFSVIEDPAFREQVIYFIKRELSETTGKMGDELDRLVQQDPRRTMASLKRLPAWSGESAVPYRVWHSIEGIGCLSNLEEYVGPGHPTVSDHCPLSSLKNLRTLGVIAQNSQPELFLALTPHIESVDIRATLTCIPNLGHLKSLAHLSLGDVLIRDLNFIIDNNSLRDLACLRCNDLSDIGALARLPSLNRVSLINTSVGNIQPLVENAHFATDDVLVIEKSKINCVAESSNFTALRARGVSIESDCPR